MSAEDRVRWDKIFSATIKKPYPPPDPVLFEYVPPVADLENPPRALDFAGGMGQNAIWLASQGYTVDLMDVSRVALNRARVEMTVKNLRNVNLLQTDADTLRLDSEKYAVVCVFRYLRRDALPKLRDAVKPGGRVVYETYNRNYLNIVPEFNVSFLLKPGELALAFAGWKILLDDSIEHVSQFVAVKPDDFALTPEEGAESETQAATDDLPSDFSW